MVVSRVLLYATPWRGMEHKTPPGPGAGCDRAGERRALQSSSAPRLARGSARAPASAPDNREGTHLQHGARDGAILDSPETMLAPRSCGASARATGRGGGGTSVVGHLARRKRAKRESVRGGTRLSAGSCLFADNERWGTGQHVAITGTTRRPRPAPVARSRCRSAPSKTPPTQSRCRVQLTASRRQSPAPAVPAHCRPRRATGC